jgi:hypothetical protein
MCVECPKLSHVASKDGSYTCECDTNYRENKSGTECVKPIVVGFFNGIRTSFNGATDSSDALRGMLGDYRNETPLMYTVFYNQTGGMMEDLVEVFRQRSEGLDGVLANRWEVFWDVLAGRHKQEGSFTQRLLGHLGSAASALVNLVDSAFNAINGKVFELLTTFAKDPPTSKDYDEHLRTLNSLSETSKGFALVAHSQGNLFVNHAFDGFGSKIPTEVVHVAPASPTLRGSHSLSTNDLVINGLRVQGITSVPSNTCTIPFTTKDVLGHNFIDVYLAGGRSEVEPLITSAVDAVN